MRTTLPEKWCIKVTNGNIKELQQTDKCGFQKGYDYGIGAYYTSIPNGSSYAFWSIPIGYEEITFEEFKTLVLKQVNYTIKGTPLPFIPKGTPFKISVTEGYWDLLTFSVVGLVSYGYVVYEDKLHIFAQQANYSGNEYWIFKLSDIEKLAKEQNMETEEREIIGYVCPTDLFKGNWKKGTLYIRDTNNFSFMYKPKGCTEGSIWGLPQEIVEAWEPVYKEEFKEGDWIYIIQDYVGTTSLSTLDTNVGKIFKFNRYITKDDSNLNCRKRYAEGYRYLVDSSLITYKIRKATDVEIKNHLSVVIKGQTAEIKAVEWERVIVFGCVKFTKPELLAYLRLFDSKIDASITIDGQKITEEIVQKLINKFDE